VWPLYSDALLQPRFDEKEFDRIRQDAINFIRTTESFPDDAIDRMAKETAFKGKDYAKDPQGTVSTVVSITAAEAKKYWESIFTRSKRVIVIVGERERAEIEKRVSAMLARVPPGKLYTLKKESYVPVNNTFIAKQRDNAT